MIAWLFPGQGAQTVGMGQGLWEQAAARRVFEEADAVLGLALSKLMFEGPKEELDDTLNTQPALYVHSIAALRAAQAEGRLPMASYVAGHSLGEYSALAAVGVFSFADGLRLVRERGRLMQMAGRQNPGGMAAVLAVGDEEVARYCREASTNEQPVQVANYNCPGQVVISGAKAAVARAMEHMKADGVKRIVPLDISIAAHSPLMVPAQAALSEQIDTTEIVESPIPIIANVSAAPIINPADIRAELKAQLLGSVQWTATVQALAGYGVTTLIEIGPGEVLTGLAKRIDRNLARHQLERWEDVANLPAMPAAG